MPRPNRQAESRALFRTAKPCSIRQDAFDTRYACGLPLLFRTGYATFRNVVARRVVSFIFEAAFDLALYLLARLFKLTWARAARARRAQSTGPLHDRCSAVSSGRGGPHTPQWL